MTAYDIWADIQNAYNHRFDPVVTPFGIFMPRCPRYIIRGHFILRCPQRRPFGGARACLDHMRGDLAR